MIAAKGLAGGMSIASAYFIPFICVNENVCIDVGRVHAPRLTFGVSCHAVWVVQAAGV